MGKFLAIDFGLERTGIAISNPEGTLAFPFATLTLKECGTRKKMLDKLAQIITAEGVQEIIIGLPVDISGKESQTCRQIRNFAARLKHRINIPVHFVSEELTSFQASQELDLYGVKKDRQKKILDQYAACLILEAFFSTPKVLETI